jgi:hypothetical protein
LNKNHTPLYNAEDGEETERGTAVPVCHTLALPGEVILTREQWNALRPLFMRTSSDQRDATPGIGALGVDE